MEKEQSRKNSENEDNPEKDEKGEEQIPLNQPHPPTENESTQVEDDDDVKHKIVEADVTAKESGTDNDPYENFKHNYFLFEWRTRWILYVAYFLLFLAMASSCFSTLEGILTPTAIIALILLRHIVVTKWCGASEAGTPTPWKNRCKRFGSCTFYFAITTIFLIGLALANLFGRRILREDRDTHYLCVYPEAASRNDSNFPNLNRNDFQLNSIAAADPGPCLIPCDIIYFYPIALLLLDLLCYSGLIHIIMISLFRIFNPLWIKLLHFCSTPPISVFFYWTGILLWVLCSLTLISVCGYILSRLGFEHDLPLCIVIASLAGFWGLGFFIPIFQTVKGCDGLLSAGVVYLSMFISGSLLMTGLIALGINDYSEFDPQKNETIRFITNLDGIWIKELRFGNDAMFWLVLGLLVIVQVAFFALGNVSRLTGSGLRWAGVGAAFILPFIPILVILGVAGLLYFLFSKFVVKVCSGIHWPTGGVGDGGTTGRPHQTSTVSAE